MRQKSMLTSRTRWIALFSILLFFLSSCAMLNTNRVMSYDDFSEISNTFLAKMYMRFMNVQMLDYDTLYFEDVHWKKKHSPVVITGKVYVMPGVTITIDPGVKVLLGENAVITSQGLIDARGTKDAPITFTWKDEGKNWNLIECVSSIKKTKESRGTVVFKHCIVEHGKGLRFVCSDIAITHSTFRYNVSSALKVEYCSGLVAENVIYGNSTLLETESGNGSGINVYTNLGFRIEHNQVYDNVSDGGRDGGGGIYAFAYDHGLVTVVGNTVKNNTSDRKAGGIFAYDALVKNNKVLNNRSALAGGGIFAIQSTVENNIVVGNISDEGGGIFSDESTIINNLIRANIAPKGSGIFHINAGSIEKNSIVDNKGPGAPSDSVISLMGNPIVSHNNIIAEKGYALSFLSHSLSPDLDANENYWGTTDERAIENKVCDWLENSEVGLVGWNTFAKEPVAEAYVVPGDALMVLSPFTETTKEGTLRGVIEKDTVIGDRENKEMAVVGNLLIREGKTLQLASGACFNLAPGASIRIRGKLTAEGTKDKIIRFTGDREKPWGNILYENRSLVDGGAGETAADKSMLRYCLIENGCGIVMDGKGADISDSVIRNHKGTGVRIKEAEVSLVRNKIMNNTSESDGGGVYAYGSKSIIIHDNEILNNSASDGGGIFSYGQQSNVAVDIRRNRIEGNMTEGDGGGIWTSRSAVVDNMVAGNTAQVRGGGIYASFALIHDNRIKKNKSPLGSGVYGESNTSFMGNSIVGNTCTEKNGGAVYLNYWGLSLHNKHFMNNLIESNTSEDKEGTGGVCMMGEMDFKNNVISKNTGIQLYNMNPSPDFEKTVAEKCFWGSTDVKKIDGFIFDGKDDPSLSPVVYEPFAKNAKEALSQARVVTDKDEAIEEF
ncbi:MAG: right-handed parallel beta-helix repeat-containing protein [Desulfobacteraceae bacterium]